MEGGTDILLNKHRISLSCRKSPPPHPLCSFILHPRDHKMLKRQAGGLPNVSCVALTATEEGEPDDKLSNTFAFVYMLENDVLEQRASV